MYDSDAITRLAARAVALMQEKCLSFATAESCTGGAVSAAMTSVPGCSSVVRGCVVAYHNDVKRKVLGVDGAVLDSCGAVSEPVVRQMVAGVCSLLGADCAVATSGIAGPGGGTPEKPVGTVWVAVKVKGKVRAELLTLEDNGRVGNVRSATGEVLELLCQLLEECTF